MRPLSHLDTTTTTKAAAISSSPPTIAQQPRSPWHSPVPYLFGGLAAMLGLIAFALLILACSYWRLSGLSDNESRSHQGDVESGNNNNEKEGNNSAENKVYEEKILVIMAGNEKPTFLATPVCSKVSSFGSNIARIDEQEGVKTETIGDKTKEEEMIGHDNHDQTIRTASSTPIAVAEENTETGSSETQQIQQQN